MTYNDCYNATFTKFTDFYIKLYKIVDLMMFWQEVVSKLCINHINMTNVTRED
jgi:hypothetical protein